MLKKPLIMYGCLVVLAVFVFFSILLTREEPLSEKNQIKKYQEGWETTKNSSNYIILTNVLPEDLLDGMAISFVTKYQFIEIKLDGELIYQFDVLNDTIRDTVGNRWHFIDIPKRYGGKTIEINMLNNKTVDSGDIPEIRIGNKDALIQIVLKDGIFSLVICEGLALFGIAICLLWWFQREKFRLDERFLCLGIIFISLSVWEAMDSQVIQILWKNQYEMESLTYLIIILFFFPVIQFIRVTFELEHSRLINGFLYTYLGTAGLALAANSLGFFNINHMYWIVIICMIISITGVFIVLGERYFKAEGKRKKRIFKHLIGFCLASGTMFFNMMEYYGYGAFGFFKYIKIVPVIYLCLLTASCFRESTKLIQTVKETEKINAIAYQDALTCLGNRAAFLEEMGKIKPEDYKSYGIAMFDLNNLKTFNDIYGHSAGDYYIIISSEIIQDMFGQNGKIYRMGGDEFCAILKDFEKDEFERNSLQMQERLEQLKGPYINGEMEIAAGYEKFDIKIDIDLSATANRSDDLMYQNKLKMKALKLEGEQKKKLKEKG